MAHKEPGKRTIKARVKHPPADLVALLVAGTSHQAIARKVGADHRTVRGWAESPDIVAEVQRIRDETLAAVRLKLVANADLAMETLAKVIRSRNAAHSVKVRAAEVLLSRVLGSPKQEIELSGGLAVRTGPLADLTDEEIAAKLDEARRATDGEPPPGDTP